MFIEDMRGDENVDERESGWRKEVDVLIKWEGNYVEKESGMREWNYFIYLFFFLRKGCELKDTWKSEIGINFKFFYR